MVTWLVLDSVVRAWSLLLSCFLRQETTPHYLPSPWCMMGTGDHYGYRLTKRWGSPRDRLAPRWQCSNNAGNLDPRVLRLFCQRLVARRDQPLTKKPEDSGIEIVFASSLHQNKVCLLLWLKNHWLQLLTNQVNNQRHKYHPLTAQYHNDSEDDDRSGCRNVSHCHQQFFSELHSPGRSHYTNGWQF